MRGPPALWRDLGPWRFLGVQVLFLGTLSQLPARAAPVVALAAGASACRIRAAALGPWPAGRALGRRSSSPAKSSTSRRRRSPLRRPRHRWLAPWVPTLPLYFPLGALAVWKALVELVVPAVLLGQDQPRPSLRPRRTRRPDRRRRAARRLASSVEPQPGLEARARYARLQRRGRRPRRRPPRSPPRSRSCSASAIAARPSTASEVVAISAIERCTRSSCCTRNRLCEAQVDLLVEPPVGPRQRRRVAQQRAVVLAPSSRSTAHLLVGRVPRRQPRRQPLELARAPRRARPSGCGRARRRSGCARRGSAATASRAAAAPRGSACATSPKRSASSLSTSRSPGR